jgi:ribonuclease P protein component
VLPKRFRLRKSVDIERLFSRGKRQHHELATLVLGSNGLEISRFGFSTSKRVGHSVKRNLVKRRFREAVRRRLGEVEPGWDCLFIISPLAGSVSFSDIDDSVSSLLSQIKTANEVAA